MYLHVDDIQAQDYEPINLDTGKFIHGVQWMNDETGEYCVLSFDKNDNHKIEIKKGHVKLVKSKEK